MPMTTIKVSTELRDRLAEIAGRDHSTLAQVVERALDAADEARFWTAVAETMGRRGLEDTDDASLREGLVPDESWDDVW